VVVQGQATRQQVSKLERLFGRSASGVSRIGGNTDVLLHQRTKADAHEHATKLEKLKFVESIAINGPEQ
jgi:hypothetical protein